MITGTAYFESKSSAISYYGNQCYTNAREAVEEKLMDGEIFLGKPPTREGQRVLLNTKEGRYFIEDVKP